ncbi:MAG: CRISPR-associated helicase Cas3', partial [Promethearchaeota archaeon]
MNFESHQGVLLKEHLKYVAEKSKEIILSKRLKFINKNILSETSYLIGITHDFGKYTTFFQKSRIKKIPIDNENLGNHSLISAFFALEMSQEYINSKNLNSHELYSFIPQIAYFIVKHHHGNLENVENDTDSEKLFYSDFKFIGQQLENISQYSEQIISEYDYLLGDFEISVADIFIRMEKYKQIIRYDDEIKPLIRQSLRIPIRRLIKKNDLTFYLISQLLFSVLIDSDKKHAGKVREIERKELPENIVEKYIKQPEFKKKNQSAINQIRNEVRKSVLSNINVKDKIFTLTAPTGTGKTLSSFSAALKLRRLLKNELQLADEPRVIYSLPFTSIIDQNFDVFDKVLNQLNDFEEHQSEYLLKHHYLADVFYRTPIIEKEIEVDESLALIESWESEIIVTTFIQLFHTLIGYKNRMLKKFHNIVNSIIILDEVQNIPLKYWSLVHDILIALSRYFNCRIILMTATKPLIFDKITDDYKELVTDYKQFFQSGKLNRVKLKYIQSRTIDEFYKSLPEFELDSYLFVFNTIGSSLSFFEKIKDIPGYKIFYLSTNIIPKERKKRIEQIKELIISNRKTNKKQKLIVISTQMVEAGVDIDCKCAYRDLGPLDSIIQVAGRCNRNNLLRKIGIVNIVRLQKSDNYDYCRIYDPILNKLSEDILKNKSLINESEFLNLIEEYFTKAKNKMYNETHLIKSVEQLNYHDNRDNHPISSFQLIENDDYYKKDIFIEFDDDAKIVWEKFKNLNQIRDPFERKTEFLQFRKDFYDYVISVPAKYVKENEYENTGIVYISREQVESCYDE